jgi:hypothetical protein
MPTPHLQVQFLFAPEIIVYRCNVAAGSGGNVANACALEAVLAEKPFCRVK